MVTVPVHVRATVRGVRGGVALEQARRVHAELGRPSEFGSIGLILEKGGLLGQQIGPCLHDLAVFQQLHLGISVIQISIFTIFTGTSSTVRRYSMGCASSASSPGSLASSISYTSPCTCWKLLEYGRHTESGDLGLTSDTGSEKVAHMSLAALVEGEGDVEGGCDDERELLYSGGAADEAQLALNQARSGIQIVILAGTSDSARTSWLGSPFFSVP